MILGKKIRCGVVVMLLWLKKNEARTVQQPELLKGSEYGSEYIKRKTFLSGAALVINVA
jgi:hypothetical protein